jgi:hypothetical protein
LFFFYSFILFYCFILLLFFFIFIYLLYLHPAHTVEHEGREYLCQHVSAGSQRVTSCEVATTQVDEHALLAAVRRKSPHAQAATMIVSTANSVCIKPWRLYAKRMWLHRNAGSATSTDASQA